MDNKFRVYLSDEEVLVFRSLLESGNRDVPLEIIRKVYLQILEQVCQSTEKGELSVPAVALLKRLEYEVVIRKSPDFCWKHGEKGNQITTPIYEMDDKWLLNSIEYLERKAVDKVLLEGAKSKDDYLRKTPYHYLVLEAEMRGIQRVVKEVEL